MAKISLDGYHARPSHPREIAEISTAARSLTEGKQGILSQSRPGASRGTRMNPRGATWGLCPSTHFSGYDFSHFNFWSPVPQRARSARTLPCAIPAQAGGGALFLRGAWRLWRGVDIMEEPVINPTHPLTCYRPQHTARENHTHIFMADATEKTERATSWP
jgi:hypothetical protein